MCLPLILLALMASGSACPDLCECHHQANGAERDAATSVPLVEVTCHDRVPALNELTSETRSLRLDGADEYEVTGLLDELDTADAVDVSDAADFDSHEKQNVTLRFLPYLDELAVTNCSLTSLNTTWRGLGRVRALNLSRNSLPRVNDVGLTLTNFSQLTHLDLSYNFVTNVSADTFRTLGSLVRLSLRGNAITSVHEEAFRGLDRLEFLDVSDNRLADLPDSALTPLYSLQKLDLSGNQLQVLGARWFESLDRLRELDVSRNGLARAASGTLQPLPGLSVLRLAENPLKERDVSLLLGTGRRLETVDASRTGLARVPAALTRSVRALRLAGNKLTTIRGGDLDSYPLLRILDISDNRLVDIEEDALGRLEVLEELDLSGNALIKIPKSLPGSLTVLKLQRNSITSLRGDDLQGLCNLESLTLNDNDIEEVEVGSLGQLPVLTELDLSDNPIKVLPANALSGPSNLATLRMSGLTSLRRVHQEQSDMAFPVSTPDRLVVLDVSRSPVLADQLLADDAALSACKSLLDLNLSEANLTTLRFDLSSYMLPQLRVLRLAGNDWNCTEDMYWVGEWTRQHMETQKDAEQAQCAEPLELAGSYLYELPSPPNLSSTGAANLPTTTLNSSTVNISAERANQNELEMSPSSNAEPNGVSEAADVLLGEKILPANISDSYSVNVKTGRDLNFATPKATAAVSIDGGVPLVSTTVVHDVSRVYEAPTSFRNVTPSDDAQTARGPSMKSAKATRSDRNSIKNDVVVTFSRRTGAVAASGPFDDSVDGKRAPNGARSKKVMSSDRNDLDGSAKLAPRLLGARQQEQAAVERDKDGRKRAEHSRYNLTKENSVLANAPPGGNTSAEELNGRATDSGARISEPMSAGAHPGMLVLAGAALGAAAALTVVLSRRATVRRRDRYHRHENIEVHTLTPTTELW